MARESRTFDVTEYTILAPIVTLMGIGLLSLSSAVTEAQAPVLYKQATWFGVGLLMILVVSRLDYRWIASMSLPFSIVVCGLLAVVLVAGVSGGGSQRWIGIGPIRLQPSELAKLAAVLWAAHWSANHPRVGGARALNLIVPSVVLFVMVGLVMLQPDLGTAVAILVAGFGVLFVAGIDRRVLYSIAGTGVIGAIFSWFFLLRPYQKQRIVGFLNPEADPLGIGYHTIQSKIAVGNGGVWGSGFGQGTQAALHFLPEQHTDFIFSVWAEEWGFVGGTILLLLFAGIILWLARAAIEAKDTLGRLLAAGIMVHFILHIGVNIAMVLGLAPVVGLPLPFLTYGGSAALTNCLAIGLVISVRERRHIF